MYNPFDWSAGCLDLQVRHVEAEAGDEWGRIHPEGGCPGPWNTMAPRLTLGPGQRIEKTFTYPGYDASAPNSPGRYRWLFCYLNSMASCAYAEFTVVEPIFRGSAVVKLSGSFPLKDAATGRDFQHPEYIQAFILEYGGSRYIGVQRRPHSMEPRLLIDPDQRLDNGKATELGPFDRIAEVGLDTGSLEITGDDHDDLTVRWREGNGPRRTMWVSKDRDRIQEIR